MKKKMQTPYTINRAKKIISLSNSLGTDDSYAKSRKKRNTLASIYKQVMNIGGSFPNRPLHMNTHISTSLYKRVSRTCPYCLKPSEMLEYIQKAKKYISEYADVLQVWLDDNDYEDLPNDVHLLRPTK